MAIFSGNDLLSKTKKIKWYKSIRVNLLACIVLIGLLPVLILLFAVLSLYNNNARSIKSSEVKSYANVAVSMILDATSAGVELNNVDDNEQSTKANEQEDVSEKTKDTNSLDGIDLSGMNSIAEIFGGRVLVVNSESVIIKDTNIHTNDSTVTSINYSISSEVTKCLNEGTQIEVTRNSDYTELISPIIDENGDILGAIVLGYSNKNIVEMSELLKQKSMLILSIVIIIVVLAAVYYSKKISQSFKKITMSIGQVREGFMDEIEVVNDFQETKELSDAFNSMLGRIQHLENSRQEFVSNVSHELKTPITSMRVLADSLIAQENTPAELYREFMVDITEELERENKIINDLLALVKLDKTASELNVASISINNLLEILLKRLRPLASKRNIDIIFESFRPVTAEVDEVKLSLALSNLIENAIKYNFEDGWIRVSLNADHKYFYVKVADSGVGIPEDCQDSIFERFYRVDKARSRDTGGSGLGLSITKNVIILHKGAIRVNSKQNEGTTFSIRIPLNYVPDSAK